MHLDLDLSYFHATGFGPLVAWWCRDHLFIGWPDDLSTLALAACLHDVEGSLETRASNLFSGGSAWRLVDFLTELGLVETALPGTCFPDELETRHSHLRAVELLKRFRTAVVLQFHSRMYDITEARAKAAAMAMHIDRMAALRTGQETLDIEQETSETLVLVAGEGAVPVPDADLLTLRQQALDAAAAATPEVQELLLLKILNLPTAQQRVISGDPGALNLHQPSGPTVTPTRYGEAGITDHCHWQWHGDDRYERRLWELRWSGGPPVPYTTASHSIQGTNAWYFVLKCQICGCGVMAVTAAGTGHRWWTCDMGGAEGLVNCI